ncbi:MAG TPA: hypothetical protein VL295_02315 [Gemmatimonadales bacterium]|jgi:hypothetical protein|nr:hypothetical protein [Gemmatimonadales bacterium]
MNGAPGSTLESLAAGWRRRWLLAALLAVAALGAAAMALGASIPASLLLVALGGALVYWKRPLVDAHTVARHLDRVHPSLEESTALLLVPPGGLSAMESVQRTRAAAAFEALPRPIKLPERPITLLRVGTAIAIAVALNGWLSRTLTLVPDAMLAGTNAREAPPVIGATSVAITLPDYLGRATRTTEGDADAAEGSRLAFTSEVRNASAAWLITTSGDSLPLAEGHAAQLTADRSFLYQVVATRDSFRVTSDWHRVTVLPDRAPQLTVVKPEERTILPATGPWRVPVEILASDDHGIASTRLLATITTGSGEGVRFREDTLSFATRPGRGGSLVLSAELDLGSLGMGPGDELYLSAQAFDGRRPVPNEGRSATLFVGITDTAQVMEAEFDGLAIDRMPDYFRSQRQIIIDTEKLLKDRPTISEAEFRRRSNDIGIDQQLLRLRYSEVAGEESSPEEAPAMGGREHAAAEPADPNAAAVADPNARVQADLTAGEGHSHDIAENATLLARSTKDLLQSALNEMWQSELQLRTFKPDTALPYERRALEFLEAVRQSARTYVKRVGLEPPPLEPERVRGTGKLDGVRNAALTTRQSATDSFPAIRALLAGATDRASFEAAGRELAALAANGGVGQLTTLRDLRRVDESLRRGTPCAGCAERLRAGLLAALPDAVPPANAAPALPAVAGRYFDRMRRP